MRGAILSIGDELLRGDIVDTNAAFLATQLSRLGIDVCHIEQAGDDVVALTDAVERSVGQADITLCTGGLGPTQDDLTRDAIASALNEEPYYDPDIIRWLEERFALWSRPMPKRNRQQAQLIPSASAIPNPNGTAPGWMVRKDGRYIVAMPGPPSEMIPMWEESVLPIVSALLPNTVTMRSLVTFGLGESAVEEKITDIINWRPDVTVATYAKSAGIEIHITARSAVQSESEQLADEAIQRIQARLGKTVVGPGGATLSGVIGQHLKTASLTLAIMESCTGGLLSSYVTDHAGSSDYFKGGIVAYTQEAKIAHGVNATIAEEFGLYSEEMAQEMARAAREHFGTDIGMGLTCIAGENALEGKASGTVFIAFDMEGFVESREVRRPGDRHTIKNFGALCALDLLRRHLLTRSSLPA